MSALFAFASVVAVTVSEAVKMFSNGAKLAIVVYKAAKMGKKRG